MEYSLTLLIVIGAIFIFCLNPYSNGILSDYVFCWTKEVVYVLILILMEYSLTRKPAQEDKSFQS